MEKIISRQFLEVIAAPSFDAKSLDVIKKKPNIRMLKIKLRKKSEPIFETKLLRDKLLVQEKFLIEIKKILCILVLYHH